MAKKLKLKKLGENICAKCGKANFFNCYNMSRIGKNPIEITKGVDVKIEKGGIYDGQIVTIKGPKGELQLSIRPDIEVGKEEQVIILKRKDDVQSSKALHGLYRTLVSNMVKGVVEGYGKKLELVGIGYRARMEGNKLFLNVGFNVPLVVEAPDGITFKVENETLITVNGIDKEKVGDIAARIRALKKPEPYKGKGIKYVGEWVRRKAGKAAKAGEAPK